MAFPCVTARTQANRYTLQFKATGKASPDFEAEPNDLVTWATPLNQNNALRGRLVGDESDYISFTVSGPPQLWRVQVAGDGLERLDAVDVTGNCATGRARPKAAGASAWRTSTCYRATTISASWGKTASTRCAPCLGRAG